MTERESRELFDWVYEVARHFNLNHKQSLAWAALYAAMGWSMVRWGDSEWHSP